MTKDVLIEEIISSFLENIYLSYSRFQSNARQDEGVIFYSQVSQWRSCEVLYDFGMFHFSPVHRLNMLGINLGYYYNSAFSR